MFILCTQTYHIVNLYALIGSARSSHPILIMINDDKCICKLIVCRCHLKMCTHVWWLVRPIVLSYCRTVALSHCRIVVLSRCRTVALSYRRTVALSDCRNVVLSRCCTVVLSYCHVVVLSHGRTVALSY